MTLTRAGGLFFVGLLTACTAEMPQLPAQLVDIKPAAPLVPPNTEKECLAQEGWWAPRGLPGGGPVCTLSTSDSRKICTDSDQCEGLCLVASDLPLGKPAIGSCADEVRVYGCFRFINKGVVESWCAE